MSGGEVRGSGFEVRGKRTPDLRTSNPEPRTASWLLAAALIAAVALTAAYQVRPTYRIEIGDATQDTALVRGFYGPERQSAADGGARYRWARENARVVFPGIGRGAVHLDLVMSRSLNPSRTVRVLANGGAVGQADLTPVFAPYGFDVPAAFVRNGSLVVTLDARAYTPPGEQRTLSVAVQEMTVRPLGRGLVLPPTRIALSLWIGALCAALALLVAGFGGMCACAGATVVAVAMAAFLIGNRLFLATDAGGVVRAGALMLGVAAAVRFAFAPFCRRVGLATTARDLRWLALIAGAVLALRFAGVLHPNIVIVDLKFHLHRFADVADKHTLLLPIQSAEFGGRTVLYAPTPYLFMLPFSWLIHDRTLLLFLFSLGVDLTRFCLLWLLARRVTRDMLAANLVVLTMALMPVGWIVYSWGTFANIFAEGMLTLLFALLALCYDQLVGPRRWRWCAVFATVICLTLLAHIGVSVLTALTVILYLLGRVVLLAVPRRLPTPRRHDERIAASSFALAVLAAALVAFALFYRFPAHDLVAGGQVAAVDQEATDTQPAPQSQRYSTGGATPDDRIGLPAVSTSHLSVALVREAWEMSFAFYRVWPVLACLAGGVALWRRPPPLTPLPLAGEGNSTRRDDDEPSPRAPPRVTPLPRGGGGEGVGANPARATAFTIAIWMTVAAIMLVVGIVARLYVRYPLFALPAIAFGSGVALAWLVRRAWWGRYVATALLAFSAITTLLMWYDRIVYAFKPLV